MTSNDPPKFHKITCRKCATVNPMVYLAVVVINDTESTCVCFDCANAKGFLDRDGNIKEGYEL